MLKRLPTHWLASSLFLAALVVAWPDQAQTQVSDQFSTSDAYDQFAVGGAHRWYDNHATEFKQKSSHCLSILDEAKTFQDTALALHEEAKRPGNSRRQTELVRHDQRRAGGVALARRITDDVRLRTDACGTDADRWVVVQTAGRYPDSLDGVAAGFRDGDDKLRWQRFDSTGWRESSCNRNTGRHLDGERDGDLWVKQYRSAGDANCDTVSRLTIR
jgi:hypothetical protein